MDCRICLSDENPNELIKPCCCTGTSAYIHKYCLDRYLFHFPSGICDVCLEPFKIIRYNYSDIGLIVWTQCVLLITLYYSEAETSMKFIFGILSIIIMQTYYRLKIQLNSVLIMSSMIAMFYTVAQMNDFTGVGILYLCLFFYSMFHYIPTEYICMIMLLVTIFLYCAGIAYAAFMGLGPAGLGFTNAMIFLIWMLWVQFHPIPRID